MTGDGTSLKAVAALAGYTCHVQTRCMADLMVAADLAIGASGSASWERCAVGLPAVAMAVAVNQRRILEGLAAVVAIVPVNPGTDAIAVARGRIVTVVPA